MAIVFGSCASDGADRRRLRSAVDAVLKTIDPQNVAVILAEDAQVGQVQDLLGSHRRVVSVSKFAADYPEEPVPYNILFQSAELRGQGAFVRMHLQAISRPPPQTLFCGTGYEYEVEWRDRKWVVYPKATTVC